MKRVFYNDGKACGIFLYRSRWGAVVSKKTGNNLIYGITQKTESSKPGFQLGKAFAPALGPFAFTSLPLVSIFSRNTLSFLNQTSCASHVCFCIILMFFN